MQLYLCPAAHEIFPSRCWQHKNQFRLYCHVFPIWEHHLLSLDKILYHIEANDYTVNLFKFKWSIQETDYLGYWFTSVNLKFWNKNFIVFFRCKSRKSIPNVWLSRCCQPLPTNVAQTCPHTCSTFQWQLNLCCIYFYWLNSTSLLWYDQAHR